MRHPWRVGLRLAGFRFRDAPDPRWGWLDESRAVIETYVPPVASVVQAVTRGTIGVVTEVAGFDSRHTFLQHRREAQRQDRAKARRERAKTQRQLDKQEEPRHE